MQPPDRPAYYKPLVPDSHRRAAWHDYCSRCIYMVTLGKSGSCPVFGHLETGKDLRDTVVELSETGKIVETEIDRTPLFHKEVKVLEHVVMPDHVHILLFVRERMARPLGHIIQGMKTAITSHVRRMTGNAGLPVFEKGFHDRIMRETGQLDVLFRYIRENPYRLAVRQSIPHYFRKVTAMSICGHDFQAYGNLQLLDNPFKEQVIVHRSDSQDTRAHYQSVWRHTAINGGVLVSPFISADERQVRNEAEGLGGKFIVLANKPFSDREKPAAHDFELCGQGRLLILAPLTSMAPSLTRARCLELNRYAALIAAQGR